MEVVDSKRGGGGAGEGVATTAAEGDLLGLNTVELEGAAVLAAAAAGLVTVGDSAGVASGTRLGPRLGRSSADIAESGALVALMEELDMWEDECDGQGGSFAERV